MQIRAAVLTWGLPHFSGPISDGREMLSERFQFHGDRETIQTEAAQMALEKVRRYLLRNAE